MALFKRKLMAEPEPQRLIEFQHRRLREKRRILVPRIYTFAIDQVSPEGIPERQFLDVKASSEQRALDKLRNPSARISDTYRYRRGRKFGALE